MDAVGTKPVMSGFKREMKEAEQRRFTKQRITNVWDLGTVVRFSFGGNRYQCKPDVFDSLLMKYIRITGGEG